MVTPPRLLLASQSGSRRRMLADAGVPFEAVMTDADEEEAKAEFVAAGLEAAALAAALAERKALGVALQADTLILGCDQTLALADGTLVDKCATKAQARALLLRMSGNRHHLHSAAVIVVDGMPVWRCVESAAMDMRALTSAFVDAYLDAEWDECRWCVGCYRIEGPGAQLFARVTGSLFTVQGLPLLPLLDFLRARRVLVA